METHVHHPRNESFFWSCITFSQDCPFNSKTDPGLFYFGVGIAAMYCAFLAIAVYDTAFYWSIDKLQQQMDYYINLVRTKVKQVQTYQHRLTSMKERTEKVLKESRDSNKVVTALRSALNVDDPNYMNRLTKKFDDADFQKIGNCYNTDAWDDIATLMEL